MESEQPLSLYERWISTHYDKNGATLKKTWDAYLPLEQAIYEQMLQSGDGNVRGTVSELAEKYNMTLEQTIGFLDGINEALPEDARYEPKELQETSEIAFNVDFEKLYKKMVEFNADHLYNLPQWDNIYSAERRKELFTEQKRSTTVVRQTAKIGRNDACPCGSGKKYKNCCGKIADSVQNDE